jgi:hypothetical protein
MSKETPSADEDTKAPHCCFVVCGWYSDRSGFALFGVYELLSAAEDRKVLMESVGGAYEVRVVKMPINKANPQVLS